MVLKVAVFSAFQVNSLEPDGLAHRRRDVPEALPVVVVAAARGCDHARCGEGASAF